MTPEKSLKKLALQLDELATISQWPQARLSAHSPRVSGWSVAEQVDHSLKVIASILTRVREPKPIQDTVGPITLAGRMIMFLGWIPRGRGRSPEPLRGSAASGEELSRSVESVRSQLLTIHPDAANGAALIVRHPLFRGFTAAQSLEFAVLHTHHHLKIIRDIVRATEN